MPVVPVFLITKIFYLLVDWPAMTCCLWIHLVPISLVSLPLRPPLQVTLCSFSDNSNEKLPCIFSVVWYVPLLVLVLWHRSDINADETHCIFIYIDLNQTNSQLLDFNLPLQYRSASLNEKRHLNILHYMHWYYMHYIHELFYNDLILDI